MQKLQRLMAEAKHVIAADALLTGLAGGSCASIVEAETGNEPTGVFRMYEHPQPRPRRRVIQQCAPLNKDTYERAIKELFSTAPGGRARLYIFTNVKKEMLAIEECFKMAWEAAGLGAARVLRLDDVGCSQHVEELTKEGGVDALFRAFDLVIVSPAMTNCVSFNIPDHFYAVLAFVTNMSCGPVDTMQGCGRPRRTVLNEVRVFVSAIAMNVSAAAVKAHEVLLRDATERHGRASALEKLTFSIATRAGLAAFYMYPEYLAACFRANGDEVIHEAPWPTEKRKRGPKEEGQGVTPYDEVERVDATKYEKEIRPAYQTHKKLRDREKARQIVEQEHRFSFSRRLLDLETDDPQADAPLGEGGDAHRNALWEMYNDDKKRDLLWAARKACLIERSSAQGLGVRDPGAEQADMATRVAGAPSVMNNVMKRYDVVKRALEAVGLQRAMPDNAGLPAVLPRDASAGVTRQRLAAALPELRKLIPQYNVQFGVTKSRAEGPLPVLFQKKVEEAAMWVRKIMKAWNPLATFEQVHPAQRAPRNGGHQERTSNYRIAFIPEVGVELGTFFFNHLSGPAE